MNYEYMINYKRPKMAPIKIFKSMILATTISYNIHQHGYRKDSQISRLATQILEKHLKEIQSRDHEVFCLHPRQTLQQWIEKYFKVLPVILAL